MEDSDYAFLWGVATGIAFTILVQKLLTVVDISDLLHSLLRAAS